MLMEIQTFLHNLKKKMERVQLEPDGEKVFEIDNLRLMKMK